LAAFSTDWVEALLPCNTSGAAGLQGFSASPKGKRADQRGGGSLNHVGD
jgi:hypothetical protein